MGDLDAAASLTAFLPEDFMQPGGDALWRGEGDSPETPASGEMFD